jgi:hypothetical protein
MNRETIVWGTVADRPGIVHTYSDRVDALPDGGMRVERSNSYAHEPASDYAGTHAWPMPMRWQHGEEVGRIVALRRAHGNLYAVGTTDLDPEELQSLAVERELKWSTKTDNLRGQPLRIVEISLTNDPATIGLPAVHWYKLGVTKGNPADWVRAELDRSEKVEYRSRGELRVHELDWETDSGYENRMGGLEIPEIFYHPGGRVIAVNGRPVR